MPKRITEYRCRFKYRGQDLSVRSEHGLTMFEKGFWLDADFKLVDYVDTFACHIWIPPSKIEYIVIEGKYDIRNPAR